MLDIRTCSDNKMVGYWSIRGEAKEIKKGKERIIRWPHMIGGIPSWQNIMASTKRKIVIHRHNFFP